MDLEMDTASASDNQPSRVWLISLFVVCLGIIAYGYLYSKNTTSDLVFLFAYNLPINLVIWSFFYAVIGRKQGFDKASLAFIAIYCSLVASNLIGYLQYKNASAQFVSEIQREFTSITRSATDAQGLPQCLENNIDITPNTKGDFGEMERFMKTFMNKMVSQRNVYLYELDAIGWDKILDAERLGQDKTLIDSKIMIHKVKEIVSKYRSKMYVLLENARKDISNLNVNENIKREIASGFDRNMAKSRSDIDSLWDIETNTIAEIECILELLSARNGAWLVQNGKIFFVQDSDLNAFNSHVGAIKKMASKHEAIRKQNIEAVNNNLSRLKN